MEGILSPYQFDSARYSLILHLISVLWGYVVLAIITTVNSLWLYVVYSVIRLDLLSVKKSKFALMVVNNCWVRQ